MHMVNIFDKKEAQEMIDRINKLTASTQPKWGKMSVDQMLAHLNVAYEMVYENKHKKPNFIVKFFLKLFIKSAVVNEKPYPKNGATAPAFKITGDKDFEKEKQRLIAYMEKTQKLGGKHFDNKESHSFGSLITNEWNNLFSKHLDHHLTQFGV